MSSMASAWCWVFHEEVALTGADFGKGSVANYPLRQIDYRRGKVFRYRKDPHQQLAGTTSFAAYA